jgi:hypothetical protein
MTVASVVKGVLEVNAALTAVLTGGIYDFDETGRTGITITTTPTAFSGPKLLPCALVKTRQRFANNDLRDEATQTASFSQIVEVYLYEQSGYTNIENAFDKIFELLHDKNISTLGRFQFVGSVESRMAEELAGASMYRMDFQRFGLTL